MTTDLLDPAVADPAPVRPRYARLAGASTYSGLSFSTLRRMLLDGRLTAHRPRGVDVILIDLRQLDELIQPVT